MRLIDADALMDVLENLQSNADRTIPIERGIWLGLAYAMTDIRIAPTVDAVPVVRCGECKYYDEKDHNCLDEMMYARCWMQTDFCSFGERREDDGED